MNLNVGDKVRVVKEVYDKSRTLKVGTQLEVTFSRGGTQSHIYRCVDDRGRTRYLHQQDANDGCFEKTFAALPLPVTSSFMLTKRKTNALEQKLLEQIKELKSFQNTLAGENALKISLILQKKDKLEKELGLLKANNGIADNEFVARLRQSMRSWILSIQFSAPHAAMRKELQGYIKELDSLQGTA